MAGRQHGRAQGRNGRRWATVAGLLATALVLAACGSGTKSGTNTTTTAAANGGTGATGATGAPALSKTLGDGVTATTIKLGVALVDFKLIEEHTDTIRTEAEQKQIYRIYIDDINAHGGIDGRKIVPDYKFYTPLGSADILPLCTSFAQDDNVFAVVGTFIDFSGDAQTCIANQQHRVLMTFNLTQAMIDKSPPGLIVTAGRHPRAFGDDPHPAAEEGEHAQGQDRRGARRHQRVERRERHDRSRPQGDRRQDGADAILDVDTTGDTTAAQNQLDSFIERGRPRT